MNIIVSVFWIIALLVLVAELWMGIAVVGPFGNLSVVEREKTPGPYWFTMATQVFVIVGLPALAVFAF